ncbi:MAG: 30S ribosomal protein S1 [Desulfotalea sp.]
MDESFADLFKADEGKKIKNIKLGQKIKARVVGVSPETTFIDIGGKSEGVINTSEFTDKDGSITVEIGDDVEVYFLQNKAQSKLFTRKIGSGSDISHLEEAWRSGIPVEGIVKEEIKGGFEITLGGNNRAFCPFSQMSLRRVEDPAAKYVGTTMIFQINKIEENGRNIVVSARAVEEEARAELKEQLVKTLVEGQTIAGEVTSIREFGAFVDIGGMDGLIPISEIGWSRVDKVEEHFHVGQKIDAIVKSIDWDKDRISLSYKETLQDPWDEAITKFDIGSTLPGKVVRLAQFGAFVNLMEGVDGLIHISKLGAGRRINHPREVIEVDQELEVKIDGIDRDARRISLAPADYVSTESEEQKEKDSYKKYEEQQGNSSSMGNLGQLLQAKLAEKKNK